jgi:hypothetical protein
MSVSVVIDLHYSIGQYQPVLQNKSRRYFAGQDFYSF